VWREHVSALQARQRREVFVLTALGTPAIASGAQPRAATAAPEEDSAHRAARRLTPACRHGPSRVLLDESFTPARAGCSAASQLAHWPGGWWQYVSVSAFFANAGQKRALYMLLAPNVATRSRSRITAARGI